MDKIYKVGISIIIIILIASNLFLLSKTKSQYKNLSTLQQTVTQVNKEKKDLKQQLDLAESKDYASESDSTAMNEQERLSSSTNSEITENSSFRDVANEFGIQLFTFKTELLESKRKTLEAISAPSIVDEIIPESMIDAVKNQTSSTSNTSESTTSTDGKEVSNPYFETEVSSTEVYMLQESPNIAKAIIKVTYQTKSKNNLSKTVSYVTCSLEKASDNKIQVNRYKVLNLNE